MSQNRPPVADSFERRMSAFLVQSDGTRAPFPAVLRFDKADPFAVSLGLRTTVVRTVTWTAESDLVDWNAELARFRDRGP